MNLNLNPKNLSKPVIPLVFALAFLVRIFIAEKLDYRSDQEAIFQIARQFYQTGSIPAFGPKLVYTGESIPGGFQAVIAGISLFFSKGQVLGLQIWVGVLNWLSMLLIYFWIKDRVRIENRVLLSVFLAFSPWSLLFSSIWNPSFLPVLAVPFFWLLEKISKNNGRWGFVQAFFLGCIPVLCIQIHLSTVLLGLAGILFLPSIQKPFRFLLYSIVGAVSGGLFLIPWLLERINGSGAAPTGVVGIHPENLLDSLQAIFRYLSFPTTEIFRFIADPGAGFQGMITKLLAHPVLFLPTMVAYGFTILMIGRAFLRLIRLHQEIHDPFSRIEFFLPLLMPLLFLFSVKGASAHTFWILMPLSQFTMVLAIEPLLNSARSRKWAWVYLGSALLMSGFAIR